MGRPDLPGGASPSTGDVPPDREWQVFVKVGVYHAPTPLNAAHQAHQAHEELVDVGAGIVMMPTEFLCCVDDRKGLGRYPVQVQPS